MGATPRRAASKVSHALGALRISSRRELAMRMGSVP
ncbi:hypothetical protein CGCSCA4_v001011 [Colletotrichum siamense]|uniref:Uncharacterized protein n=1 Tax=Colletotrichum siamense TaxID=690259 RepID=A0A9P5K923_COLSI|nr:hypothetical protein CGCSCA4_v001011 [Colletotrichum siamense]KAF4866103.1 hypothetical protein CGCSCA2_v001114 [Colletotrichum siamense]